MMIATNILCGSIVSVTRFDQGLVTPATDCTAAIDAQDMGIEHYYGARRPPSEQASGWAAAAGLTS